MVVQFFGPTRYMIILHCIVDRLFYELAHCYVLLILLCIWVNLYRILLISAPSLGVLLFFVVDSVCLYVRLSVCHGQTSDWFFFVFPWNRANFWPSVFHDPLYKTLFFDFWFRSPNAQNLLPKICKKWPITWLVWQIDQRCLCLLGSFWGWPIQRNHAKCGADPCCHGNNICARRGDLVAYRLVWLRQSSYNWLLAHCFLRLARSVIPGWVTHQPPRSSHPSSINVAW